MVRPHAPRRAELRPRGRDDEQRACAPRSASARMRSSEVGSAQCRSSKASTTACVRAAARIHPPSPPIVGGATPLARFRRPVLRQEDIDQRREQRRISVGSRPISPQSILEVGERCSAGRSAPKRCRPDSAIGCSGVFCNSCDDDHSTRCAAFRRGDREIPRSAWTCPSRAADDQRELALALRARSQRRARRSSSSSRPTAGSNARSAAPAATARANDAIEVIGADSPLTRVGRGPRPRTVQRSVVGRWL